MGAALLGLALIAVLGLVVHRVGGSPRLRPVFGIFGEVPRFRHWPRSPARNHSAEDVILGRPRFGEWVPAFDLDLNGEVQSIGVKSADVLLGEIRRKGLML